MDRLLLELSVEGVDPIDMRRQMARQPPVDLDGRTASLVPVSHAVARDDHLSRDAVERVVNALPPVEPQSGRDEHLTRRRERYRRLEPDRVARTEQLRTAGVGATLKQRVECLEVRVRGILVAARDVEDDRGAATTPHRRADATLRLRNATRECPPSRSGRPGASLD